jgi:hypothetical protein
MNNFIKKIFGIDKIEAATEEAVSSRLEAEHAADMAWREAADALESERIAKASPKELATENKEPWIAVLETHVNADNPRNGFFEFDWNEYFITFLRENGYTGGSDEEVVDVWFQDLCKEVGVEENVMMDRRFSGYINVNKLNNGKSEVS